MRLCTGIHTEGVLRANLSTLGVDPAATVWVWRRRFGHALLKATLAIPRAALTRFRDGTGSVVVLAWDALGGNVCSVLSFATLEEWEASATPTHIKVADDTPSEVGAFHAFTDTTLDRVRLGLLARGQLIRDGVPRVVNWEFFWQDAWCVALATHKHTAWPAICAAEAKLWPGTWTAETVDAAIRPFLCTVKKDVEVMGSEWVERCLPS